MRVKEIILYKFDELSDDAKEKARDNYRSQNWEHGILWQDELFESLKGLLNTTNGLTLKDWSLGLDSHSYIKIEFDQEEAAQLSGPRALAWIENNLLNRLRVPYQGQKRKDLRKYGPDYYAGKIKPCPFTGVCFDEYFLEALLEDIKTGHALIDCFKWLADKYVELLQAEYDYQNSDEYIDETLTANEYEFTIDGVMA